MSTFYLNRTTADKSTSYRRDLISTYLYAVPARIPLCETECGYQIAKWSVYEVAPGYLTTLKHDFYFQVRQNVSLVWSNKLWIFCWSVSLSQLKALPGLDAHVLGKRKLSSSHKRIREGKWLPCTRRVLGFSRIKDLVWIVFQITTTKNFACLDYLSSFSKEFTIIS